MAKKIRRAVKPTRRKKATKMSKKDGKSARLEVRVSESEHTAYGKAAKLAHGGNISKWARSVLARVANVAIPPRKGRGPGKKTKSSAPAKPKTARKRPAKRATKKVAAPETKPKRARKRSTKAKLARALNAAAPAASLLENAAE